MRHSRQRDIILETVRSLKTHPTADTIYELVRQKEPNISLGTVYRNLALLESMGEIDVLYTSDSKIHYDGDLSEHTHFICNGCKSIIDVFASVAVPDELSSMGVDIEKEKVIYYGKCADCAKA